MNKKESNNPEEEKLEDHIEEDTTKKEKDAKDEDKSTLVVSQLPQQSMSSAVIDGKNYDLITIEDALTELLTMVRRINKAL